ncbi:DUF1129 domain-containing protein [Agrilactobacillus yilanensis]|uniref:DUF1129 domain-containing protein n=1 Tax=Agrilactobacillus yilanensis TaxID=2485997 RepID=A0ABW4J7T3_9LACO|nr:DUF1129 family protein [Agrilactobacillus yilanensis]
MDNRERNAAAAEHQKHAKAVQEKKEVTIQKALDGSLDEQFAALTKRNREYVFRFRKALSDGGMPEEKQVATLEKILPEIIVAQHKGQPATQLYGPPVAKANSIVNAPEPPKKLTFWVKALDSILLFAIFMFAFAALSMYTAKNRDPQQLKSFGLLSLILITTVAGGGLAFVQEKISAPKEQRLAIWKLILLFVGIMAAMFLLVSVGLILPDVINPVLPAVVDIVVAVALFGIRFYIRRRYGIKGNIFGPTGAPRNKA